MRPSDLYNGNPYIGKIIMPLYWDGPQVCVDAFSMLKIW